MRRFLNRLFVSLFRRYRIGALVPVPIPMPVATRRSEALRRVLPAFLLIFLAGRVPGRACDTRTITLWWLAGQADLIAVARIVKVEPRSVTYTSIDEEEEIVEETDIHLSIEKIWKGQAPGSIVVAWEDGDLREGDLVLAVLQSDETLIRDSESLSVVDGEAVEVSTWEASLTDEERHYLAVSEAQWRESIRGRWHPGGDAGMRRVSESDLPVLEERIREALALQAKGEVSREAFRAWLVSMAERRPTRSDALLEMMYGNFAPIWRPEAIESLRAIDVLTEKEIARILDGFIAEPSGDGELSLIIDFFEGHPDASFDRAVVSAVEGMLARTRADESTAQAVKAAVMRITGDERPIDVHVTPDVDQLRSVWEEVLERWEILRAPAADVPELPASRD